MNEGGQRVQTFTYKMRSSWNLMYRCKKKKKLLETPFGRYNETHKNLLTEKELFG